MPKIVQLRVYISLTDATGFPGVRLPHCGLCLSHGHSKIIQLDDKQRSRRLEFRRGPGRSNGRELTGHLNRGHSIFALFSSSHSLPFSSFRSVNLSPRPAGPFTRSVTPPSDPAGTRAGPVSHRQAWPPGSVAALPQPELSDPERFLPPNSPESCSSSA
jgi:hypothetical protein